PPTAGSCGCAPLVGTSHSLMATLSSATPVAGRAGAGLRSSFASSARATPRACPESRRLTKTPQPKSKPPRIVRFLLVIEPPAAPPCCYERRFAMNVPWLGSASPMVIPSVVQREQFLLAGSDPSTQGFRQNPEDRAKANAFWRASNPLLLDTIPRRWQRSDPRGVGNK